MTDPTGHLIEFIEKNRIILGLVQANRKGRLAILTASDKQLALPQQRALLLTAAAVSPERPRDAVVEYLRQVEERREALAGSVAVDQLWELVHEEANPLPLSDLAELQFGRPLSDDQLSATLRALFREHLHFRLVGNDLLPLSAEQLAQKLAQQEREETHRLEVDSAVAFLKDAQAGVETTPAGAPPGLIDQMVDLVVLEDEAPAAKKTKEILALAEVTSRRRAFKLLVDLGVFSPHENLPLRREDLPRQFSPEIESAALAVAPRSVLGDGREDLTSLHTFTIDGLYTTDFDDALSFEPAPDGGGVMGVHITDAAALLPADAPLDLEARERATTLYLADERIPMLPPRLSEDALSLREGELRPAISCLVNLSPAGEIGEFRLCRSVLKVHRRLTYEEADGLLASDPRLKGLHEACLDLRAQRGRDGAYFLPLPEVLVRVDENSEVFVRRVDRDGPSREMVAETAIVGNMLMGRYLAEHKVPTLFRTQAPPHEPIEEGDPGDLFLHFRQRRLLNRVEITTSPGLHSSLGVTPYVHATSPIRRYLDLVIQRQLGAVLAGREPVYSEAALRELCQRVEPAVKRAGRVRLARHRYWLLRWLDARRGQKVPAIVMEYQLRRWQLLLTDVMLLVTIPSRPGLSLEPGQPVEVTIEKADAFEDILRVALD